MTHSRIDDPLTTKFRVYCCDYDAGTYAGPIPYAGCAIIYWDTWQNQPRPAVVTTVILSGAFFTTPHAILAEPKPAIYASPLTKAVYPNYDAFAGCSKEDEILLNDLTHRLAMTIDPIDLDAVKELGGLIHSAGGKPAMLVAARLAALHAGNDIKYSPVISHAWHGIGDWEHYTERPTFASAAL